jgi:GT2 family glycosyltransferase
MRLSVIIPVHNGGDVFRRALDALEASSRAPDQLVVVADGSTDDSAMVARCRGGEVVAPAAGQGSGLARGPAFARNRGAASASGDILVFLDADVAVHVDTLARIEQALVAEPGIAAMFGSYDANPPAPGAVSQYKNLLHHYVHQHASHEASTFWAGCGAIRRETFSEIGGFDERYARPSIEDIELGGRLRRAGHRIRLCPDIQVTHLKHWTVGAWLRADVFDRAVPWTRLLVSRTGLIDDLNLDFHSRLSAVAAWLGVVCVLLGLWRPLFWGGAPVALAALALLNADLYRFFARQRGLRFAVAAGALHGLYLLYSSATFALVGGWMRLSGRGMRA